MKQETKDNIKRWIISSGVTFLTAFSTVLLLQWDSVTLDSLKDGSLVGIAFTATRAGVKGLLESFLFWRSQKK